jgi:hypothetical protein
LNKNSATQTKYKELWFYYKKIWYMPFIWSLTWFSYWIFHDIVVLKTPPIQVNPVNYVGTIISIAFILAASQIGRSIQAALALAGTQIKTSIKAAFAFVGTRTKRNVQAKPIHTRPNAGKGFSTILANAGTRINKIFTTKPNQPRTSAPTAPAPIETFTRKSFQMQKPKLQKQRTKQLPPQPSTLLGVTACPHNLDYFARYPRSEKLPDECLICENVIQCVSKPNKARALILAESECLNAAPQP